MYSLVENNFKLLKNSKGDYVSSDGYIITDDEKKETLVVYIINTLPQKLVQKYMDMLISPKWIIIIFGIG